MTHKGRILKGSADVPEVLDQSHNSASLLWYELPLTAPAMSVSHVVRQQHCPLKENAACSGVKDSRSRYCRNAPEYPTALSA